MMKKKTKRKRTIVDLFLNILIVALLLSGIYLIIRPRLQNYFQDKKTNEILQEFDEMSNVEEGLEAPVIQIVIGRDDFVVQGESLEDFGYEGRELDEFRSFDGLDDTVGINVYARIEIPKIDLVMPVSDEASLYSLRVTIGHYAPSPDLGEVGNAVFFGHRMYAYGRHFNRVDELLPGDKVVFRTFSRLYTYEVYDKLVIEPWELPPLLESGDTKDKQLTLVTCTPLTEPRGTHRLLILGKLIEDRPLRR